MSTALILEFLGAAAIAWAAIWALSRGRSVAKAGLAQHSGSVAFLFDGVDLINATQPANDLLRSGNAQLTDLDRLIDLLEPRFPNLRLKLAQVEELGQVSLHAMEGASDLLIAETHNGYLRVLLSTDAQTSAASLADEIKSLAQLQEITELRAISDECPQLIWRENRDGSIGWANRTYLDLAQAQSGQDIWPPVPLFTDLEPGTEGSPPEPTRHAIMVKGDKDPRWFEVTSIHCNEKILHAASDVTDQVRAKDIQRDLTQTLTKTFAGLSVGLAVFDRNRQLVLFNPALSDLTGLNPSHLVVRPSVETFLDLLREKRITPEVSDFSKWRKQMAELAFGPDARDHVEDWDLFDGRSYQVTCRPFPNGAIAVLIEDVSSDHALATQLQSALRLGQEALDGISEAVCVFSDQGALLLENEPCTKLWGESEEVSLEAELARWRRQCAPTRKWDDLLKRVRTFQLGKGFAFTAQRNDGRTVQITARPTSLGGVALTCRADLKRSIQVAPLHKEAEPAFHTVRT